MYEPRCQFILTSNFWQPRVWCVLVYLSHSRYPSENHPGEVRGKLSKSSYV